MERNHLGNTGTDGTITLKWILEKKVNSNVKIQLGKMFSFKEFHEMFSEHPLPVVHIKISQLTIQNSPHLPVTVLQKITVLQDGTFGICCSLLTTVQYVSNIATPFAASLL
jgi:hypothetical protein